MRYKKIIPSKQDVADIDQMISEYQNADYCAEAFGNLSSELEKQAVTTLIQNHQLHRDGKFEVVDMSLGEMFEEIVRFGVTKK